MTTLVLGAAGAASGDIGLALQGIQLGAQIDTALGVLPGQKLVVEGPRLEDLQVQTSTYGRMVPQLYGTARVAGNVIWSKPIMESATTTESGSGKGGSGRSVSQTSYSYSVTLAIAICEGEIDEVVRVWADAKTININDYSGVYRLYKGTEDQLPDSAMEAELGSGFVPAYRGVAYVVIEDFPLEQFGNRIPNFTFEVRKSALNSGDAPLEEQITAMTMIPGSGEFVYDTNVQKKLIGQQIGDDFFESGEQVRINQNNVSGKADVLASLDQLEATFPNLEWVSVVVTWFGDDVDAGGCTIKPYVEYKDGATTEPDQWGVGSWDRASAPQISLDENGNPVYGGTPSDASVARLIGELKSRGYQVMLYPMFFMDTENKPWRGRVTGSVSNVANFFTKTNGYNEFITHYANLADASNVDAFVIGSELVGLTSVQDSGDDSFPAVDALVSLAASVKAIVGSGTKVTYAADWSEYHHTDDGWYNLDPLWASANIDFIGIDAYFPLTDEPQSGITLQKAIDGWTSGEGYDWVYTDEARTTQAAISPQYAWKNLQWFWENEHVNPDASTTAWVPESKPFWFTEYGFPSVDGATNQPNVFYDPTSSESYFPRFSRGRVDNSAQRLGLQATETAWEGSTMVEQKFVWTWDARPFSFWPEMTNIWTDGGLWKTGHWVNGKMGLSSLAAIVQDIGLRAGLNSGEMDVTKLSDLVEGYVLKQPVSARSAIAQLQAAYFFDAREEDGQVDYLPRGNASAVTIAEDELVPFKQRGKAVHLAITRGQEADLPKAVEVNYLSRGFDYQIGTQRASRQSVASDQKHIINFPIVMGDERGKMAADVALCQAWTARMRYQFILPPKYAAISPADVVTVTSNGQSHTIRIMETTLEEGGRLRCKGIAEDVALYESDAAAAETSGSTQAEVPAGATRLKLLDVPLLAGDDAEDALLRVAVSGEESGWQGSILYRSDDGGARYGQVLVNNNRAVMGKAITALADGAAGVMDVANNVTVLLSNGTLESVSTEALLNGANAALLGGEVIQFTTATLVSAGEYRLSGLLRGRLGTEHATVSHAAGDDFVLLDSRIGKVNMPDGLIGLSRLYKAVSIGETLGETNAQSFAYNANALKPYAPAHVAGERDGAGNLTISWIRRTRHGGSWRDGVDVPLSEASEAYEIDILDGEDVVRTLSASTPSVSYDAADQTSDFGSPQSSVSVKIYQMSERIGRGRPAEVSV